MTPISQSYRIKETLKACPTVARAKLAFEQWCDDVVCWNPKALNPALGDHPSYKGRSYDVALTLAGITFAGAKVAELGSRFSFFSPYVTAWAKSVHVSDLFAPRSWDTEGAPNYWGRLWRRVARKPGNLIVETRDMQATGYADGEFDVVVSFSAIEHIRGDGDIEAARELGRITKPGGFLVISTDLSDKFRQIGGYYYDDKALQERIIGPTGCDPFGEHDLSWAAADKWPHRHGGFEMSAALFVLKKPL